MKKISVNKNDCSFENKNKFEDLLNKVKALGGSIIKNGKQTFLLAVMAGCILFSANNIYEFGAETFKLVSLYSVQPKIDEYFISYNDAFLQQYNGGIIVANITTSIEQEYYFENNYLFDNNGNVVSLNGVYEPICFAYCNINREILENTQLTFSQTKILNLDGSNVNDECIEYLPSTLEWLSLNRCSFITNLNDLPKICPNITKLSLNNVPNLSDLSFIYNLPNLKEIYISESAYITDELLDYLKSNNITTNITEQDVINSKKTDEIINSIVKPNMSDKEKIQAVCLYVLNNVEYDSFRTIKSNLKPLTCALEDGKGVCASYAYLTNVLLNKANIISFKISNGEHTWNIVELDNKYYYIDTTNMDDIIGSAFYNFLLKELNITKYYMVDTDNTLTTPMSNPTDDITIIPLSLVEDIQNGESEKNIFEKYGGQVGNFGVILASVLAAIATYPSLNCIEKIVKNLPDLYSNIKSDYKKINEEYNSKKVK